MKVYKSTRSKLGMLKCPELDNYLSDFKSFRHVDCYVEPENSTKAFLT